MSNSDETLSKDALDALLAEIAQGDGAEQATEDDVLASITMDSNPDAIIPDPEEIEQSPRKASGGTPLNLVSFEDDFTGGYDSIEGFDRVQDIPLDITVELGRTKLLIRDILELGVGSIIELEKMAGEPVDLLANGLLVARGEVVVIEDNFGVRVTEIITAAERGEVAKEKSRRMRSQWLAAILMTLVLVHPGLAFCQSGSDLGSPGLEDPLAPSVQAPAVPRPSQPVRHRPYHPQVAKPVRPVSRIPAAESGAAKARIAARTKAHKAADARQAVNQSQSAAEAAHQRHLASILAKHQAAAARAARDIGRDNKLPSARRHRPRGRRRRVRPRPHSEPLLPRPLATRQSLFTNSIFRRSRPSMPLR